MEMNEWNTLKQYREFRSREEGSRLLGELINRGILPEIDMNVALYRYKIDMAIKNREADKKKDENRRKANAERQRTGARGPGRPRKYAG